MKKSLIALAAVAASGFAMAQSSVTLFGVLDANVTHVNGQQSWTGMEHSGNSSSRLGFRGVEDLGNGLKAQFWLEGAVNPDNGGTAGGGGGANGFEFKRRSTVSLMGNFGEVRLGRSTTAAYDATSRYDVFGTVGVGASQMFGDVVRASNMIGYYSPDFSGFKVGVNYGFGEVAGSNRASRYLAAAATYDNGPLSLGLGLDRLNRENAFDDDMTRWSLGGSYNFGVAKLSAAFVNVKYKPLVGTTDKSRGYLVAVSAPVGAAGEVKASYNRYEDRSVGARKAKADQFSLGYVHSLSKRTAVYGTYAHIKGKNGLQGITLNGAKTAAKTNGKQHGFQVGVRHSF